MPSFESIMRAFTTHIKKDYSDQLPELKGVMIHELTVGETKYVFEHPCEDPMESKTKTGRKWTITIGGPLKGEMIDFIITDIKGSVVCTKPRICDEKTLSLFQNDEKWTQIKEENIKA